MSDSESEEREEDRRESDFENGEGDIDDGEDADEEAEASGTEAHSAHGIFELTDQTFDELTLPGGQLDEVQGTWAAFLRLATREAAGEAIYGAFFDSSPSLQHLFKTPRAVMASRIFTGIHNMVNSLGNPKALKVVVETLGFTHLEMGVTLPRASVFGGALADLLSAELGDRMTEVAKNGWISLLNYAGGAFVYLRVKYNDRLKILASSWATANNRDSTEEGVEEQNAAELAAQEAQETGSTGSTDNEGGSETGKFWNGDKAEKGEKADDDKEAAGKRDSRRGSKAPRAAARDSTSKTSGGVSGADEAGRREGKKAVKVPKTFNEMFQFNAAVMGFGGQAWMREVLTSFDAVVTNVTNPGRLQEECDLISLRIVKCRGPVNLDEYKAVMLASLRSLVPKDWNSAHEVAWGWLWETVERMIKTVMGKLADQKQALSTFINGLDDLQVDYVRRELFARLFAVAPNSQDFIKVSAARQGVIADRIVAMTLEIYKEPGKLVQDISALGLRHVGYGIPTELFGPFVTAILQVMRSITDDEMALEAFRWSAGLISRILVRVVSEGSTVVMKAINANSARQLQRAVASAPRADRAMWVLQVQVGIQSISPLVWALQTGAFEPSKAIIQDLLTMRADRDRYYFGADQLFSRHPDIIKRICSDAPALLPTLMDGLIWRSRITDGGKRRVNYYFKYILVDNEGNFAKNIEWLVHYQDPKIICHPVMVLVMDMVWSRLASRIFLSKKVWFIVTLLFFIVDHSILPDVAKGVQSDEMAIASFTMHMFVYVFSMGQLLYSTTRNLFADIRDKHFAKVGCLSIPNCLTNWQDAVSFTLTIVLLVMCAMEPMFHCIGAQGQVRDGGEEASASPFRDDCPEAEGLLFPYSVVVMLGTGLYFALLVDLTVFSHRVWAFVLLCSRLLKEVLLFAGALTFCIAMFCCSIAALKHKNESYKTIPDAAKSLFQVAMSMSGEDHFAELVSEPVLLIAVSAFVLCTLIFLLNLLVAQLSCSFTSTYEDNIGYARLNRGSIVVDAMATCSAKRWAAFVDSLRLEEKLEFTEGDVGLPGGISVMEPAAANPTTADQIRRYGGSSAPGVPWPEDDATQQGEEDRVEERIEKMEHLLQKTLKRMNKSGAKKGGVMSSTQGSSAITGSSGDTDDSDTDQ